MKHLTFYLGLILLLVYTSVTQASNIPENENPEKTSEVENFDYRNGMLQWETYAGVDVKFFLIESSENSEKWKLVNEVDAYEKIRYKHRYTFDLRRPKKFYRLSVINTNGDIKQIGVIDTSKKE
ncbi:hypothetical protein KMW28_25290 [Flammeovirga yaeyamensis]|uniref:Uncharacterized protein n=1 Tax=Flammeovirga yaeyamensis TaxID=367791 RepID=A0AAX1N9T0_9BACT|nr:hypothetical protein [Flammeovirga yaeyamensis]MBB3699391.1 hypothetical protein [Flammeovirga yaeyamensis]NMF35350.1 hypothetical protein [Flammeovirga yaeyamensis]QWG04210.1 hypothetical protein KMW28_25290 [Flammeovirga yaeyamensis]